MADQVTVQEFDTVLEAVGGNNVAIVVPDEVVAAFDRGKRPPVIVTVDGGYTFATTVGSMGGRSLVSFNRETREQTGRGAGDTVSVRLELELGERVVEVPDDLASAVAGAPGAQAAWDALAPSKRKAHATSVADAKTPETRERRIAKIVDGLTGTD